MYYNDLVTMAMADGKYLSIIPKMANRHGLIAGATGTGKTITLKVMAEAFSDAGVPVFMSDVKGDLAGMCQPGLDTEDMQRRIERFALADKGFSYRSYPTRFWDIYGRKGLPLRTTVTEFGPLLLARILGLNQIQSDILNIVFKIADDEELLLLDVKDLKAMLNYVSENSRLYKASYGNIAPNSVAAIMRALVALEDRGAGIFFGEPAIDIRDWFVTDENGRGMINVLAADSRINDPTIYSTFLLWMMSELFEVLPEVGDQEKPKMIFFFDEAHLLFDDAPKALLQKIEQVVKLIRSKGVGIYFVTQNPKDIPNDVLAQLGNKVQHALHSYTPAEQKGIKAAAESFRVNPAFKTEEAIQNLGTGEALVSFLQADGSPAVVEVAKILPPQSRMGAIDDNMRLQVIAYDSFKAKYDEMVDRDSAYEFLLRWSEEMEKQAEEEAERLREEKEAAQRAKEEEKAAAARAREEAKAAAAEEKARIKAEEAAEKAAEKEKERAAKKKKKAVANVASSAVGTVGREVGKTIGGSVGGSFGKKIGGNVGASLGRGILSTLFKS